jgi:SLOG cluster3 family
MRPPITGVGHRLLNKTIFLSASVPSPLRQEEYLRVQNAAFEIDQAVISLTRAVLSESGQLVFGGHPSISPLVAMVAAEYREPRLAESGNERQQSSIHIYQSRAFQGNEPQETLMMYQLGYAELIWTDAVAGERYDPKLRNVSQCTESLRVMRLAMIRETQPAAMVCIGGMDGVEREVEIFREVEPRASIFVLEQTGGASQLLPNRRKDVRVMDTPVVERIRERRRERSEAERRVLEGSEEDGPVVPYPLIMQMIVDEVAREQ